MAGKALYGVKVVSRYAVSDEVFYEERVLRLRAESFEDAMERAEAHIRGYLEDGRLNMDGQPVGETICEAVHAFQIFEDGEAVEETFSRIVFQHITRFLSFHSDVIIP